MIYAVNKFQINNQRFLLKNKQNFGSLNNSLNQANSNKNNIDKDTFCGFSIMALLGGILGGVMGYDYVKNKRESNINNIDKNEVSQEEIKETENIKNILKKLTEDGGYYPQPGSKEAIEFLKYQDHMLKTGKWKSSMIGRHLLLGYNNLEIIKKVNPKLHITIETIKGSLIFIGLATIAQFAYKLFENKNSNSIS